MIAAGQTLSANETRFGKPVKLVRVMPNTPALVGEAMSAVCFNANITPEDRTIVMAMLNSFGKAEEVPEKLMDAVTGVSGSSPAYVYMFIEAMADAAVLHGMPRNRRIHLPHSRCSALQKWYWKLVCTQANSKTTSALPAERPLKQSLLWRPAACDPLL